MKTNRQHELPTSRDYYLDNEKSTLVINQRDNLSVVTLPSGSLDVRGH